MSSPPASRPPAQARQSPPWLWDVFCQVIDNFGDIGVCWRLCADVAQRGHTVRLWVDDSSALDWMAPGARQGLWPGVTVRDWSQLTDVASLQNLPPSDVWIEGFGCNLPDAWVALRAQASHAASPHPNRLPTWINLEYLSAEAYVARCHALPSPVMQGPAQGWTKHFYYPGFTDGTGGLLREPGLEAWQRDLEGAGRQRWLERQGVRWSGEQLISLFCYEPPALAQALADWMQSNTATLLLVTPGRAARAVHAALPQAQAIAGLKGKMGALRLHFLDTLSQQDFDALLHCCDLNLVRGEDSLVRALWAGKPFVWHIYPQDDGAHAHKLQAFLDCMGAPPLLRQLQLWWNGLCAASAASTAPLQPAPHWGNLPLEDWKQHVQSWRARLRDQPDLVTALIGFVEKRR